MINTLRLLVVDDDIKRKKSLIYEVLLDDSDFEVTYCENREEFLEADFQLYDAVVLDINLTTWRVTFPDALSAVGRDAPIILITSRMHESSTSARIGDILRGDLENEILQIFDLSLLDLGTTRDSQKTAEAYRLIIKFVVEAKNIHKIGDDEDIRILHISDPQYGDPNTSDWVTFLEHDIAEVVSDYHGKVDMVAITGDIAYSGTDKEYELALVKLRKLVTELTQVEIEFAQRRLILVPGNHDVDFTHSGVESLSYRFKDGEVTLDLGNDDQGDSVTSIVSMAPFRRFAFRLTGDPRWILQRELFWVDRRFSSFGLRFIILNTAENISHRSPKAPSVPSEMIDELSVEAFKEASDYFNIAISHHGPIDPDYPDHIESLDEDWSHISSFMRKSRVKLWLHGHGHHSLTIPFPYRDIDASELSKLKLSGRDKAILDSDKFLKVMAPTTHLNQKLRAPGERKGFNIIKLKRQNGVVTGILVQHYEVTNSGVKERNSVLYNLDR